VKFEVVNSALYDDFMEDGNRLVSTGISTYESNNDELINYKSIVTILNDKNGEFLPDIDKTTPIIFYNFSAWSRVKARLNVMFQKPSSKTLFGKVTTAYIHETESIYINKNLYTEQNKIKKNNEHEVFNYMLESGCTSNEATNLILLHEIGHAVHHQLDKRDSNLLESTTQEASFINPFIQFNGRCVNKISSVTDIAYKAITEGFADLYSCIIVDKIYDASRADSIINALYQYRNSHKNENYYSEQSIDAYLKYRHGGRFENFNDIYKYISSTVAKTAVENMGRHLKEGSEELGVFIGVVNKLHGFNHDNIDKTLESMSKNYPFIDYVVYQADKKNSFGTHPNLFAKGCIAGDEWIKKRYNKQFKKKIKGIKNNLSSGSDDFKNTDNKHMKLK
jgi:hypothetical protein